MILDPYERYWEPLRDGGGGDGGGGGGGDEGAPEGAGPEGAPSEAPGVGPDAGPGGIGTGFDATGGVTGAAATGGGGFGAGGFGSGAPTSDAGVAASTAASGQTGAAATGGAGGFGGFGGSAEGLGPEGGFGGAGAPGPDGGVAYGYEGPQSGLSPDAFNAPDFESVFGSFQSAPTSDPPGWAGMLGISDPSTGSYVSAANPASPEQAAAWTAESINAGGAPSAAPAGIDFGVSAPTAVASTPTEQQSVIDFGPTTEQMQHGLDVIGTHENFGPEGIFGPGPGGPGGAIGQGGVSGDGGLTAGNPLGLGPLSHFGGGEILGPGSPFGGGPPGPEAGITLEDGTVVPPEVANLFTGAGITDQSTISQILREAIAQGGDVGANLRARLEALLGGGGGVGLPGDWRQDGTPVQAGPGPGGIGLPGDWRQDGTPVQAGPGPGGIGLPGDWRQDGTPVQAGGGLDGTINGPQDLPPQFGAFQEWMRGKTLAQIVGALDSGRVA